MQTEALHIVAAPERTQWNDLVSGARTGYITQLWEWGQLSHLGTMHQLAVAGGDGSYQAAMLMIEVTEASVPFLGRPYLYAPRGPVCDDPHSPALARLLQAAADLARQRGCFMLKVEPQAPDGDSDWLAALERLGLKRNPYANHPRRSWMVDITPTEQELLANMKTTWRYNINRGQRRLIAREGHGPDDRAIFYRIYHETAERDHFFVYPQSHYDQMIDLFEAKGDAVLFLAEYEGVPIAAQVVMTCGAVATSMFSASSNLHRNQRPNHLLQWTAIRWAKAHGCTIYDFRAIAEILEPTQELYGLYAYKHGFGGYSFLSLETHDAVYQPAIYWAYRQALQVKRRRNHQRYLKMLRARQGARDDDSAGTENE
jgi:peptidoglycan pentaglycine glycine transferase (the first glycine)